MKYLKHNSSTVEMTYKRINITLPPETYDKLQKIAEKEDRPISNVIKRLIESYSPHR